MPDSPASDHAGEVDGMNIFWVLFILISVTVLHPLGRAPGFSRFTRYERMLPLSSALDAVDLYVACIQAWRTQGLPFRKAARAICNERLQGNLPPADNLPNALLPMQNQADSPSDGDEDNSRRQDMQSRLRFIIAQLYLDSIPRVLANIGIVLTYAKVCGFRGVPYSLAVATVCFSTWMSMEAFLVVAFWFRSPKRMLADSQDGLDIGPNRTRPGRRRPQVLRVLARILVLVQIMALLGIFIAAAVTARRHGVGDTNIPEPPPKTSAPDTSPPAPQDDSRGFFAGYLHLAGAPWRFSDAVWDKVRRGLWYDESHFPIQPPTFGQIMYAKAWAAPMSVVLTFIGVVGSLAILSMPIWAPWLIWTFAGDLGHLVLCCCGCLVSLLLQFRPILEAGLRIGRKRALLLVRLATAGALVLGLVYFNMFWDGTGTSKEGWTGKLD
ncbi:hypothetical protein QBC37DRAFT_406672 [Rhypophila decipiens]|uniref:Uncharacterized protein n=1 Tax=Rhypophila decipiens TaxID=261697 RepID=A0AAN7B1Z1_9PEZI|nr:hypothetical protein QBC37DRAFT_406672 [Rhypophila decipiens]